MFIYIASAGGVGGLCKKLLAQLQNDDVRVVLCKPALDDIEALCAEKNIPYIKAYQKSSWLFPLKISLGILGAIVYTELKYKPKKMFCWGKELALLTVLASFYRKTKISFFSGSYTSLHLAKKSYIRRKINYYLYRWCFKQCTYIGAQTKDMASDLTQNFGVHEKNIILTPPFIVDMPTQIEHKEDRDVVFLGRLAAEKNIDDILLAYKEAQKQGLQNQLAIYGDGNQKQRLIQLAKKIDIPSYVFKGAVPSADIALKNAKILVLSSHFEGFPTVILEALSYGIPVVSYDFLSGPSEIIRSGVNGFLVPNKDVGQLAEKITEACSRPWDQKQIQQTVRPYMQTEILPNYRKLMFLPSATESHQED